MGEVEEEDATDDFDLEKVGGKWLITVPPIL
jgi:hypothetical protein